MDKRVLATMLMLSSLAFASYTPTYNATDLANMGIDLGGTVIKALVDNASAIVSLGIVGLLLGLVGAAIAGVFAVFRIFRKKF